MQSILRSRTTRSTFFFALLFFITKTLPQQPLFVTTATSITLALLISIWWIYSLIISNELQIPQSKRRFKQKIFITGHTQFTAISELKILINGRFFNYLIGIIAGCVLAFISLIQLSYLSEKQWLYLCGIIPLYVLCRHLLTIFFKKRFTDRSLEKKIGNWSIFITSILMLLIYSALEQSFNPESYSISSIEAVRNNKTNPFSETNAPLFHELVNWSNSLGSYKTNLLGYISQIITRLSLFISICSVFSCIHLPKHELIRIISDMRHHQEKQVVKRKLIGHLIIYVLLSILGHSYLIYQLQ